jgi:hypothetical protein
LSKFNLLGAKKGQVSENPVFSQNRRPKGEMSVSPTLRP